jgi:putative transposase
MANAFAESLVGTIKRECLDHFMCFSVAQLRHINAVWLRHYNSESPHQGVGIDNNVIDETFEPQVIGEIRCKSELGGLIKSYYREAA